MLSASDIRSKYLKYLKDRGHKIIPSSSLVPENDPTTLFTGSGMQPMMPYLLGQPHPLGKRLVDSQKSFRAQDIEEVGDNRHDTFFEMLGNWSLGDYFKKEQLGWFFEFLTRGVGIDPSHLYVSVFIGDKSAGIQKDTAAIEIWQKLFMESGLDAKQVDLDTEDNAAEVGMQDGRIFAYGVKKNWWARNGAVPATMPVGEPGGPDSEVFYDFGTPHDPKYGPQCHPNCDCGRFLEIGNSVFMTYQKQADGSLKELDQKNVDFGGGLERITAAANNDPDIFKTDLFTPIIDQIEKLSGKKYSEYPQDMRIIADHLKASVFLISDGITPSNKDRGYVLRRLLRRAALKMDALLERQAESLKDTTDSVIEIYKKQYFSGIDTKKIKLEIGFEMFRFEKTLRLGLREFENAPPITYDSPDLTYEEPIQYNEKKPYLSAKLAFRLYESFGFPLEETIEEAKKRNIYIPKNLFELFEEEKKRHQELSRTASTGMFKGGLADHSETVTKYHTATHLLQQALRDVLGNQVHQAGSNLTSERLRFDFTYAKPLTEDEIAKVEDAINTVIAKNLPVTSKIMSYADAVKAGALAFFKGKYPPEVTVYSIGSYSKEVCGGPHVAHTGEIGKIKIVKQESAGSSLRRVYLQIID